MARPLTAVELRELQAYLHIWYPRVSDVPIDPEDPRDPTFNVGASREATQRALSLWRFENRDIIPYNPVPSLDTDALNQVRQLLPFSTQILPYRVPGRDRMGIRRESTLIERYALEAYREHVVDRILRGDLDRQPSPQEILLAETSTRILATQYGIRDFALHGDNIPPFPANVLRLLDDPRIRNCVLPRDVNVSASDDRSDSIKILQGLTASVVNHYITDRNISQLGAYQRVLAEASLDILTRSYGMVSPVARVDGRFESREIIDDLGIALSNDGIEARFRRLGAVLHQMPVPDASPMTSDYGWRPAPREGDAMGVTSRGTGRLQFHEGIDWGEARTISGDRVTTEVAASLGGGLRAWGYHPEYGNFILLEHPGGSVTLYPHLTEFPNWITGRGSFAERSENIRDITLASTGAPAFVPIDVRDETGHKQYFVSMGDYGSLYQIPAGVPIGTMGRSGRATGVHLHHGYGTSYSMEGLLQGRINAEWTTPIYVYSDDVVNAMTGSAPATGLATILPRNNER